MLSELSINFTKNCGQAFRVSFCNTNSMSEFHSILQKIASYRQVDWVGRILKAKPRSWSNIERQVEFPAEGIQSYPLGILRIAH